MSDKLKKRIKFLKEELGQLTIDYINASETLGLNGFYGQSWGRLAGETTQSLYNKKLQLEARIADLEACCE